MLSDILKREYIKLNVECKNWEEAIKEVGIILLEHDIIEIEYIEETIKNVKELGPYIVIAKGVAMPHATGNFDGTKSGIAFVRLKNPIKFGNSDKNPVSYVFMLVTTDMESYIEGLSELSDLLQKDEFYDVMEHAERPEEIIEYIKTNEEMEIKI